MIWLTCRRTFILFAIALVLSVADAFVPAPAASGLKLTRSSPRMMVPEAVEFMKVGATLIAEVAEPGSVAAPGWIREWWS
jgi:hypothetical protein